MSKSSLLFLGLFIGCAHTPRPESISLSFSPPLLENIQRSVQRTPASVVTEGKSPRRIYFTTLYQQYLTLGNYLGKPDKISYCPQFHHDRVEAEEVFTPAFVSWRPSGIPQKSREFFPETAFNEKFSLNDYQASLQQELMVLCEEGVSDNYFKFDNLITHYSHKQSFHKNTSAMNAILKIPVFANYYLVKMLDGQNSDDLKNEFITLTNTFWFEKYVAVATKVRNNLIKEKLVKR